MNHYQKYSCALVMSWYTYKGVCIYVYVYVAMHFAVISIAQEKQHRCITVRTYICIRSCGQNEIFCSVCLHKMPMHIKYLTMVDT